MSAISWPARRTVWTTPRPRTCRPGRQVCIGSWKARSESALRFSGAGLHPAGRFSIGLFRNLYSARAGRFGNRPAGYNLALEIGHLVSGLTVPPAVLPASPLQRALCPHPGSLLKAGSPPRLAAVHRRAMPASGRLSICLLVSKRQLRKGRLKIGSRMQSCPTAPTSRATRASSSGAEL